MIPILIVIMLVLVLNMARIVTRVGEVTAVNTATNLTAPEGGTQVDINITDKDSRISQIIGTAPTDAAVNGCNAAIARLTGDALPGGTSDVVIGGNLVDGTPAAAAFTQSSPLPLDLVLQPGTLRMQGILEGDDTGDGRFGVSAYIE